MLTTLRWRALQNPDPRPPRSGDALGWLTRILPALLLLLGVAGCDGASSSRVTLRLLTGSENRDLVPILDRFEKQEKVEIETTYEGSVDTMLDLEQGGADYDAVWPASSIWLALGNTGGIVSQEKSIMRTPVVFAVKRSVAERLGWVGRDVTVGEILAAAESGQIRYMMTSATQSNSGAMAYLGYLYAFAGHPSVLTSQMLHDPAVVDQTRRILKTVSRSAGASGFLRDVFFKEYDSYDGMVNNESAVITINGQLIKDGREPLYVVYPVDGLAIADWPLGYIDRGDAEKGAVFAKLQSYLLSEEVAHELLGMGRRTGPGINPVGADPAVFNPSWGIDVTRPIVTIRIPAAEVIREALDLYQTSLRKPSFTVYCLDFSGSMQGKGEGQVKDAMRLLLDPQQAGRYLLQPSTGDVTVVIPFNAGVINEWRAVGNDPAVLAALLAKVTALQADGGTNIYEPVIAGLNAMSGVDLDDYSPAIILMTDGESNAGTFAQLKNRLTWGSPGPVPVYAVLFGEASETQLKEITEATSGAIFDGRSDLIDAIRVAKTYN